MVKLTNDQMIKIIKEGKLSTCTEAEKDQIMVFAFGEEYMRQADHIKGTLETYEEAN
jgi:hypothetical protein